MSRNTSTEPDTNPADEPTPEDTTPEGDKTDETTSAPDTVAEAGEKATEPTGDAYAKGYLGTVPSRDGDNPEDLTLQGVLKNQGQK